MAADTKFDLKTNDFIENPDVQYFRNHFDFIKSQYSKAMLLLSEHKNQPDLTEFTHVINDIQESNLLFLYLKPRISHLIDNIHETFNSYTNDLAINQNICRKVEEQQHFCQNRCQMIKEDILSLSVEAEQDRDTKLSSVNEYKVNYIAQKQILRQKMRDSANLEINYMSERDVYSEMKRLIKDKNEKCMSLEVNLCKMEKSCKKLDEDLLRESSEIEVKNKVFCEKVNEMHELDANLDYLMKKNKEIGEGIHENKFQIENLSRIIGNVSFQIEIFRQNTVKDDNTAIEIRIQNAAIRSEKALKDLESLKNVQKKKYLTQICNYYIQHKHFSKLILFRELNKHRKLLKAQYTEDLQKHSEIEENQVNEKKKEYQSLLKEQKPVPKKKNSSSKAPRAAYGKKTTDNKIYNDFENTFLH